MKLYLLGSWEGGISFQPWYIFDSKEKALSKYNSDIEFYYGRNGVQHVGLPGYDCLYEVTLGEECIFEGIEGRQPKVNRSLIAWPTDDKEFYNPDFEFNSHPT